MTSINKFIISGSYDQTIRIWNFLQKRQETVLQGHLNAVTSTVVTTDNKYIISGSLDKTIRVWNLLGKKLETTLQGHSNWVTSVPVT